MRTTHPLNVFGFCPRCGHERFQKSDKKSLRCTRCGFHLFVNAAAAVAALISDGQGRLLLTTRGVEPDYGKLDLPGGFIDPGESAENAVVRELDEELGLNVKSLKYMGSAPNEYIFSELSVFTLDMAFGVVPESLNGLKPMDDILEYRFYAAHEIDYSKIPAPSIQLFVKQFFQE